MFKVLGPLEVTVDGRRLQLDSAPKAQLALAVLLANAGTYVSTDAIMSALWDDRPPRSARRNLHLYIHRLRNTLGHDTIASRGGAYAIMTGERLDSERFRRLRTSDASAADSGNLASASLILREALDLWRGPAFVDFLGNEFIGHIARGLEQLRAVTYEQWADIELALGRHHALWPELVGLAQANPYNENVRAQLLLALFRSGRQAEALEHFRDFRELLVAELGTEPGAEIQELHRKILANDPALAAPPIVVRAGGDSPAAADAVRSGPQLLPANVPVLYGRAAEMQKTVASLARAWPGRAAVVALHGPGGVGKSAIAVAVGHAFAARFPDGQLYINLHGATPGLAPVDIRQALGQLLRALGVHRTAVPATLDESEALYRSTLAGKRVLILADNAASFEQVASLIPAEPMCGLIATSRAPLASLDAAHVPVGALSPTDAESMLADLIGEQRSASQCGAVAALAMRCSGLPLALRIAAGRLIAQPDWTVADLVDRLDRPETAIYELTAGDERLRASFVASWREVCSGGDTNTMAARIFLLFAAVRVPDMTRAFIAAILGETDIGVQAGLDRLIELYLLESDRGRYRPHDLLRMFAIELGSADIAEAQLIRAMRWYDNGSRRASQLAGRPVEYRGTALGPAAPAPELDDTGQASAWLDEERANLVTIVRQGSEATGPQLTLSGDIALGLYPSFIMRCYATEYELICRAFLDRPDARTDPRLFARVSNCLGSHLRIQGRLDEALACLEAGLAALASIAEIRGQGGALEVMASIHTDRGEFDQAITLFEEALRIRRACNDPIGEGTTLTNAAEAYLRNGQPEIALQMLHDSLALRRQTGDTVGEGITNENLAEVYLAQRETTMARKHADEAVAHARSVDARDPERRALTLRARIALVSDDIDAAVSDLNAALALAQSARPTNPSDLYDLAKVFRASGHLTEADRITSFLEGR